MAERRGRGFVEMGCCSVFLPMKEGTSKRKVLDDESLFVFFDFAFSFAVFWLDTIWTLRAFEIVECVTRFEPVEGGVSYLE